MDACAHRENTRIIRSLLTGPCQVMCFSATYTADSVKDIEINVFKVGRCWSCKMQLINRRRRDVSRVPFNDRVKMACDQRVDRRLHGGQICERSRRRDDSVPRIRKDGVLLSTRGTRSPAPWTTEQEERYAVLITASSCRRVYVSSTVCHADPTTSLGRRVDVVPGGRHSARRTPRCSSPSRTARTSAKLWSRRSTTYGSTSTSTRALGSV